MAAPDNSPPPPLRRPFLLRLAQAPRHVLSRGLTRYRLWRLARTQDPKEIFTLIQRLNFWDSSESVSGPGSTFVYTENLRHQLPALYERFAIKKVLDAPCGDFNWMRHVQTATHVLYTGGDIVPTLIRRNTAAHENARTRFQVFDITRDPFPAVDLWLCRDCLFHLPLSAIYAALENFASSSVPYALLTNHREAGETSNQDIRFGGFRKLDLMAAPFHLPDAVHFRITEGPIGTDTDHEMCLWSREQIAATLPRLQASLSATGGSPRSR